MREKWTDYKGKAWPVITSTAPLNFRLPSHAALRRHVFHRDGYKRVWCETKAKEIPEHWDGVYTLYCERMIGPPYSRYHDMFIVDHIVSRRSGGKNVVDNLQTLCETCNKLKRHSDDREYREMCN